MSSGHIGACHLLIPIRGLFWSSLGVPWAAPGAILRAPKTAPGSSASVPPCSRGTFRPGGPRVRRARGREPNIQFTWHRRFERASGPLGRRIAARGVVSLPAPGRLAASVGVLSSIAHRGRWKSSPHQWHYALAVVAIVMRRASLPAASSYLCLSGWMVCFLGVGWLVSTAGWLAG